MRRLSEDRKLMIRDFLEQFYRENYRKPRISEIAAATELSKSVVHRYLKAMDEEGIISYSAEGIVTDSISKISPGFVNVGICGVIPCGSPTEQEELIEEFIPLPVAIFGKGDFFILRASGDSMIEAGIDNGDLVVVRRDLDAKEGDIVAALIDNHESTLKTLKKDPENRCIILHPENKTMEDIKVTNCTIQGVAVNVIKSLQR